MKGKLDEKKILDRANELYAEAKLDDVRRIPSAFRPRIESDQVKSLLTALVEALNGE